MLLQREIFRRPNMKWVLLWNNNVHLLGGNFSSSTSSYSVFFFICQFYQQPILLTLHFKCKIHVCIIHTRFLLVTSNFASSSIFRNDFLLTYLELFHLLYRRQAHPNSAQISEWLETTTKKNVATTCEKLYITCYLRLKEIPI